jgi:hypothetical protein
MQNDQTERRGAHNHATQAQFAALMGWNRSTVTRAKQAGRLVMVGSLVDVEASRARLADTAGMRFDVAERHAAARGQSRVADDMAASNTGKNARQPAKTAPGEENGRRVVYGYGEGAETRAEAQARKEAAAADLLVMELEQKRGNLIPREDVDAALKAFAAATRARIDAVADQLAPLVAPVTDLTEVNATLAEHMRMVLAEIAEDMRRAEAALVVQA